MILCNWAVKLEYALPRACKSSSTFSWYFWNSSAVDNNMSKPSLPSNSFTCDNASRFKQSVTKRIDK